ncbi:MAG: hypothetical protein U1F52_14650 [Burkholderiales bacterium]
MGTFATMHDWQDKVRYEYPDADFQSTTNPEGINAVCEGVLVGRYFVRQQPPYGVIYANSRSCGAKPW